ncbi:MAG: epoxyqueuosine reductase [Deltaproteobacteria bacterium]|nr:epoxyqueuosine reductase [Deltaproteobacteria bacterium]
MRSLSNEIQSLAHSTGADMVGFAPVERFVTGPEKTRPVYYMPTARSVVAIGIGYPRSIGEVWGTYAEERGLPGPYMWFGFAYLNWELSRVALKVAKVLEGLGYKSLPVPPAHTLVQYRYYEHFDEWNRYLGDFSHKHAALAAGLGVFGWSNLFLTPTYGARQRLISVITEAPLEPAELMDSKELCKPEVCGYACVETCPIGALRKDQSQEFTMDGQTIRYGALDHMRCRWCLDGFTQGSGSRTHFEPPEKLVQADFARAAARREIPDKGLYLMSFIDFCGKCMHQCPSPTFAYTPRPSERFPDRTGCRYLPR